MKRMKLRRDVQAPTRFTTEYAAATARVCIVRGLLRGPDLTILYTQATALDSSKMGLSHFKTLEDGEESVKRTSLIVYPYQVTLPCHLFGEGISLSSCTDDYVSKESRERLWMALNYSHDASSTHR